MPSVIVQDSAITWSQGAIVDRSRENVGPTDAMIIRVRRRLLATARALREHGTIPPGVDQPEVYRQRSGWALVPKDADFWDYLRPLREGFNNKSAGAPDAPVRNGTLVADSVPAPEREKQPV
jgi:hypothetical protein